VEEGAKPTPRVGAAEEEGRDEKSKKASSKVSDWMEESGEGRDLSRRGKRPTFEWFVKEENPSSRNDGEKQEQEDGEEEADGLSEWRRQKGGRRPSPGPPSSRSKTAAGSGRRFASGVNFLAGSHPRHPHPLCAARYRNGGRSPNPSRVSLPRCSHMPGNPWWNGRNNGGREKTGTGGARRVSSQQRTGHLHASSGQRNWEYDDLSAHLVHEMFRYFGKKLATSDSANQNPLTSD
jgi:hypothetical protein